MSDEQSEGERNVSHFPTDVPGVHPADDLRVVSGIVHLLRSRCRWCDCPPEYGPAARIYNRVVRWLTWDLRKPVPRACRPGARYGHANGRRHARQSAPLDSERKKWDRKQVIGRARGGHITKIHAAADADGPDRDPAGVGEAHDCRSPNVFAHLETERRSRTEPS
ncbi:transposase [Bradyrhizobium sp. 192]|nr:transposase [Bradyrhizobium sp. 192]